MKNYECMCVFPPEGTPESRKRQEKSMEEAVKKCKGSILRRDEWGKKPLGYVVKKNREGFILIYEIQIDPLQVEELKKVLERLDELLKYFLVVKTPGQAAVPEPPSQTAWEKKGKNYSQNKSQTVTTQSQP